jgi:large subunit ribosomal protein L18
MANKPKTRQEARDRRHRRVRKKLSGTPDRPRLCVFRSLKHVYAHLVDDTAHRTILTVSSLSPEVRGRLETEKPKGKLAVSKIVGQILATKAKEKGLERARFDRGGYLYHGRVRAVAEGAREAGLTI